MIRTACVAFALMVAACSAPGPTAQTAAAPQASNNLPPEAMHVLPAAAGWNAVALDKAVAYVGGLKSTGFVVIDDGRIIAEYYWPLPEGSETFEASFVHGKTASGVLLEDVASQQKSFIAILIGVAVDKGLLDVNRTVTSYLGAGWSKAPAGSEAAITVRNLLEMNSGLKEDGSFEAPAGQKFFYNTPIYAKLKPVLEAASGMTLDAMTRDWLTAPVGMSDTAWRQRPGALAGSGNPTGLVTTPRDVAKMGQLILDGGVSVDGKRVVSQAQIRAMMTPSVTNPAYGRLWWLNSGEWMVRGPQSNRVESALIPSAPRDLVAAQGAQDRKLYVVPSRKLVVVRMGQAAPREFNEQLWTLLTAAMPAN